VSSAWLSLLAYMDPDGLRELLGERAAFECHERGVRDLGDRGSWPAVAARQRAPLLSSPATVAPPPG